MHTDSIEVEEINLLKRKADSESNSASPPPPKKVTRIDLDSEVNNNKGETNEQFNAYQYWKDPLPDIESELNIVVCHMICEN